MLAAALSLSVAGAFGAYGVVSSEVSHPHPSLERVTYTVQVGTHPLNRFGVTRIRKSRGSTEGVLILLSPFLQPGTFYEISETGKYLDSAAGRLAQSSLDVWLVDQRRTGLAPGSCESGTADCSVLGTWDFDALSKDALFATALARSLSSCRTPPVIGGFSAGSNTALATVNRRPNDFSGLFLFEGTFFTEEDSIRAHNQPLCEALDATLAAGTTYDPSVAILGLVLNLAAADPNGLFPLPFFPPGTTNQEALLFVYGAPPPAGAFSPTPGFIRAIADFDGARFVYTNQKRLELVGPLFDNYAPVASMKDLACGLAGVDDRHYRNLHAFRGDVLVFVEGTGFGQALFDTVSLFEGARSVTIDHNPELGEADPYFHHRWKQVFLKPLRDWVKRTL